MAQRDLTNFREVITQVADTSGADMLEAGADITGEILRQGVEAKINENISKVQLDLNALNHQYQIDFEGNPLAGKDEYKQKRQELFDTYAEQISPLYRRQWQNSMSQIANRDDALQQAWALKQTRVNTVSSINTSMKNNFMQANLDGQDFGERDDAEIASFVNFATSKEQLAAFGNKNLGEESTAKMLETYEEDYMKSFLSGVSETNPVKALRLLDTDMVKDTFSDPQQYMKMKEAVEARALKIQSIRSENEILSVLKDENSLLASSLERPLSYAELQQEFARSGMSKEAQSFFMKINGYSDKEAKLDASEKLAFKAGIYDMISQAGDVEDLKAEDITAIQNKIYEGMNRGALSEKEGMEYLNGFLAPAIEGKEESLKSFQSGKWNPFQDNIGFTGLSDVLEQVNIEPPDGADEVGALGQIVNNENKVKLYDYYWQALTSEAGVRNMAVADIPRLPTSEKRKIYAKAQNEAKRNFWIDKFPELGSMEKIPASIITSTGKKINTGLSDGSPVSSVSAGNTKIATDANGNKALVEVDKGGNIVRVIKELP